MKYLVTIEYKIAGIVEAEAESEEAAAAAALEDPNLWTNLCDNSISSYGGYRIMCIDEDDGTES